MSYGVIIARFQVPELHMGHSHLVKEVMKRHKKVLILLGVSGSVQTDINPLSYDVRKKMVQQHFSAVDILPLYDMPDDNQLWSNQVDEIIKNYDSTDDAILYGSRNSFSGSYFGTHKVVDIQTIWERSGTDVRQELIEPIHTTNFRAGIIHHIMARLPIVYPTVDIVCYKQSITSTEPNVLVCRKKWETKWRFPGGFISPEDDSGYAAARREFTEEVGPLEVADWKIIGSVRIPDLRYRGSKDSIMSTIYQCTCIFGTPIAQDDIVDAKWMPVNNNLRDKILNIHYPILDVIGIK